MTRALTIKQEKFCNLYIELGNTSEAYRQRYDCSRMKDETINERSSRLVKEYKISARIKELQAKHAARHNITVDSLIDELEEARELGRKTEKAAAMVSATMGKAKLLGLVVDKGEITGKNGAPLSVEMPKPTKELVKKHIQELEDEF